MSGIHSSRQGFVTKSTIPSLARIRGLAPSVANFNINAIGAAGTVVDSRVPRDEGPFALAISNPGTGNTASSPGSASPYRADGYWSCDFNGSNEYLSITDSIGLLNFTSNFGLEAWVYLRAAPGTNGAEVISKFVSASTGWYSLTVTNSLTVTMRIWDSSNAVTTATSTATIPLNTWVHIAGGKNPSGVYVAVGGQYTQTASGVTPRSSNAIVTIGINSNLSSNPFNGMISNVRASWNFYTANFTPPTTPVIDSTDKLSICNSPSFYSRGAGGLVIAAGNSVSLSPANPYSGTETQVPGSGSFSYDGSIDYFKVANSSALDLTSGDWTIEGWFFATAFKATETIIFAKDYQSGTSNPQYGLTVNATKKLVATVGSGTNTSSRQDLASTTTLLINNWYHFAFVKSGTTLTLYLNGRQEATATQTATMTHGSYELSIGTKNNLSNGTVDFAGYIGDIRIVKGTALYSGTSFTPSLQKLTAVTNTSLLLVASPAAQDAAADRHQLRSVLAYPAEISPYGASAPGSFYCPISGPSSLASVYRDSVLFAIGTQTFTFETWVYLATNTTTQETTLINVGGVYGLMIHNNSNGSKLSWRSNSSYRTTSFTKTSLVGKWTHIAVTRAASGVMRFFVDGVLTNTGAGANPSTYPDASWVDNVSISGNSVTIGGYLGGFISRPRITLGAQYTASFTPPTTDPTVDGFTLLYVPMSDFGLVDSTYMATARSLLTNTTPTGNAVLAATAPSGLNTSFAFNGSRRIIFAYPGDTRGSFGSADFTVECFVRVTSTGTEQSFIGTNPPVGTYFGWFFGITATGALILTRNSVADDGISVALTWEPNTWYHVAAVRRAGNIFAFRDGVRLAMNYSVLNPPTLTFDASGGGLMLGARHNTSSTVISYFNGNIAAARVTPLALYLDATYTVPSLPLQPVGYGPNFVTNAVYGVYQLG